MLIHCSACGVTSPRDLAELARPSGRCCLVCGAELTDEAVSRVKAAISLRIPGRCRSDSPVRTALRRLRTAQLHVMH
jgi:hypothetical protein